MDKRVIQTILLDQKRYKMACMRLSTITLDILSVCIINCGRKSHEGDLMNMT